MLCSVPVGPTGASVGGGMMGRSRTNCVVREYVRPFRCSAGDQGAQAGRSAWARAHTHLPQCAHTLLQRAKDPDRADVPPFAACERA